MCTGDCDGNGQVVINELVSAVNIGLERAPVETCPAIDANGDDDATIDELISAVNNALNGCG